MQISTICEIEFQLYDIGQYFFENSFKRAVSQEIVDHIEEHIERQMSDLIKSCCSKRPFLLDDLKKGVF